MYRDVLILYISADSTMAHENARILLVEDDVDHAELLMRFIKGSSYGFSLRIAGSVRDAYTLIQDFRPHLIIADALLSDGRYTELLKKTHTHTGEIPIILLSSEKNGFIENEAKRAGIIRYMVKSANTFSAIPDIAAEVLGLRE